MIEGGYNYRGANGEKSAQCFLLQRAKGRVIDRARRDGRSVDIDDLVTELWAEESVWEPAQMRTIRDAVSAYERVLQTKSDGGRWSKRFRTLVTDRLQGISTKESLVRCGEFTSVDDVSASRQNAADQRRHRDRKRFMSSIERCRSKGGITPRHAEVLLGLLD